MTMGNDDAAFAADGETVDVRLANLNERLARAGASFDAIRCAYGPQEAAVFDLDRVRLTARYASPGSPRGGAMLVAPFGTGKTHTIETLTSRAAADAEPGTVPVLSVQTSVLGTTDSVPTSILHALRVPRPDVGNEKARWLRATDEMRRARVELVTFDEFNRAHRRPTMSAAIVSSVREWIMDPGLAAVCFVGSEDARTVLAKCPDVVERLDDEIDLSPLDWISGDDQTILVDFLGKVDDELTGRDLLRARSGLADAVVAQGLCEASGGRIRSMMKVVRHAMLTAMRRNADAIETCDLYEGVDLMCIRKGFADINPFG